MSFLNHFAELPWLHKFHAFKNGIPVNDTNDRLIRAIKPTKMTECFINWVNEMR